MVLLTLFSSMDFADGVGVYFPHRWIRGLLWSPLRYSVFRWGFLYILGMGVCSFHAQVGSMHFFSSSAWSMYVFPVTLLPRTGCGFSPVVSYAR